MAPCMHACCGVVCCGAQVDPSKTGNVSLQQFMQVWQNYLQLWDYEDQWLGPAQLDSMGPTSTISTRSLTGTGRPGKKKHVLTPTRRFYLDRNMAAAVFVKYGFDKVRGGAGPVSAPGGAGAGAWRTPTWQHAYCSTNTCVHGCLSRSSLRVHMPYALSCCAAWRAAT